jgi:hypothetical protein
MLGLYIGENEYEMSEGFSGLSFKEHETSKILGK